MGRPGDLDRSAVAVFFLQKDSSMRGDGATGFIVLHCDEREVRAERFEDDLTAFTAPDLDDVLVHELVRVLARADGDRLPRNLDAVPVSSCIRPAGTGVVRRDDQFQAGVHDGQSLRVALDLEEPDPVSAAADGASEPSSLADDPVLLGDETTFGMDADRCRGDLAAEIARVQAEVDIAAILGVPGMRHDASGGWPTDHPGPRSFEAALPRLAEGCRGVTGYAAAKGIKTMVENHGFFCQESLRVEQLVTAVNHPNFGLLIDIGNFLCADDDPAVAVGRLLPYALHCHAKDFHVKPGTEAHPGRGWFESRAGNYLRGAIIGHGNVPLAQCLRVMHRAGYKGVLSIEFEGMEDVLPALEIGHENLRRLVQAAAA